MTDEPQSQALAGWLEDSGGGPVPDDSLADADAGCPVSSPLADDLGAVFVNWVVLEEDLWTAVWQRGEESRSIHGPRVKVFAWALAQPASRRLLWSTQDDDWKPLQ